MSLSRMNCMVGRPRVFVFSIQAVREASTARKCDAFLLFYLFLLKRNYS